MQNEMKLEGRYSWTRESVQIFMDLRKRECADIRGPKKERVCRYA